MGNNQSNKLDHLSSWCVECGMEAPNSLVCNKCSIKFLVYGIVPDDDLLSEDEFNYD